MRYYQFWYPRQPWNSSGGPVFQVDLHDNETDQWQADVLFRYPLDMQVNFDDISVHDEQEVRQIENFKDIMVTVGSGTLDDDAFACRIADVLRQFIAAITPIVDELASESDGEA